MSKLHISTKLSAVKVHKKKKTSPWRETWHRFTRNKAAMLGMITVFLFIIAAVEPRIFAPEGMDDQNYSQLLMAPCREHILGTDNFGRDIFSRIVYGSRVSVQVGLISVGIACFLGGILGAVAGYYGGKTDNIIMRFMDVMYAIPSILLAISIAATLGPGLFNMMIAIGLSSIPVYARVVRAAVLTVRGEDFVEASRAVGAGTVRLIFRHMIPNAMGPIIVQATLGVANAILSAAGLSFLGLGVEPPTPEWGSMLSVSRQYYDRAWWFVIFPGVTIMIVIFALNLVGDGLRDALDPKLKR